MQQTNPSLINNKNISIIQIDPNNRGKHEVIKGSTINILDTIKSGLQSLHEYDNSKLESKLELNNKSYFRKAFELDNLNKENVKKSTGITELEMNLIFNYNKPLDTEVDIAVSNYIKRIVYFKTQIPSGKAIDEIITPHINPNKIYQDFLKDDLPFEQIEDLDLDQISNTEIKKKNKKNKGWDSKIISDSLNRIKVLNKNYIKSWEESGRQQLKEYLNVQRKNLKKSQKNMNNIGNYSYNNFRREQRNQAQNNWDYYEQLKRQNSSQKPIKQQSLGVEINNLNLTTKNGIEELTSRLKSSLEEYNLKSWSSRHIPNNDNNLNVNVNNEGVASQNVNNFQLNQTPFSNRSRKSNQSNNEGVESQNVNNF